MKKYRKPANIIVIAGLNLLVFYVLACTYLWARQSHFIFMPHREIKKTSAPMLIMRAASMTWIFQFFWFLTADTG